jgi:hypothetical protein
MVICKTLIASTGGYDFAPSNGTRRQAVRTRAIVGVEHAEFVQREQHGRRVGFRRRGLAHAHEVRKQLEEKREREREWSVSEMRVK